MEENWISVKNGLPEDHKDLLIWDGYIRRRGFFEHNKFFINESGEFKDISYPITHWMPLPNPPKV